MGSDAREGWAFLAGQRTGSGNEFVDDELFDGYCQGDFLVSSFSRSEKSGALVDQDGNTELGWKSTTGSYQSVYTRAYPVACLSKL